MLLFGSKSLLCKAYNLPFSHWNCILRLRNIACLHPLLTNHYAQTRVHAFILSHIDFCNSLFIGFLAKSLEKLQHGHNSAVSLLAQTKHSAHITSIYSQLQGLPVQSHIKFKFLLLSLKVLLNLCTSVSSLYFPSCSLSGFLARLSTQDFQWAIVIHRDWPGRPLITLIYIKLKQA